MIIIKCNEKYVEVCWKLDMALEVIEKELKEVSKNHTVQIDICTKKVGEE
jgi:hypothetical protein